MLRGFDVSHYQGSVDWASLKSRYGITWGAAKATEAETGKDSRFAANWRGMKAAGLVRMAYSFAHPDNSPADDAKAFLDYVNAAGGFGPEDIAVMDMESNSNNLPMLAVRDWLAGWADIVTKATGRKPFLYCGSGYIRNNSTKDLRPHYAAWWFPRYSASTWPSSITGYPSPNNWGGAPDIWQFSESFNGMDANIANMTLADLKTRGRSVPVTPPKPPAKPPVKPTEDTLSAQDVEDGIDNYMQRFYSAGGTGGINRKEDEAWQKAMLDGLNRLAAAVEALKAN